MMLVLYLATLTHEINCESVNTMLEFHVPISLTCTEITEQSYSVSLSYGSGYGYNNYIYNATISDSNTLTFIVTDEKPFTYLKVKDPNNRYYAVSSVVFKSNPAIEKFEYPSSREYYAGRWNEIQINTIFDQHYYGKGENSYSIAISQDPNETEDIFQENSLLYTFRSNEMYFYIPINIQEGNYYIILQFLYKDINEVTKKSNLYKSRDSILVKQSISNNQLSVELQQDSRVLSRRTTTFLQYEAYPAVPFAKIMYKAGEFSTDLSLYSEFAEIVSINEADNYIYGPVVKPDILHKITFVLIDTKNLQILNQTEIDNLTILPEFEIESYTIDNPKDPYGYYFLQPKDVMTGTITFKYQTIKEYIEFYKRDIKGTLTEIPGESQKFKFSINVEVSYGSFQRFFLTFDQKSDRAEIEIMLRYMEMNININHYLPVSGIIGGDIYIHSNLNRLHEVKTVAKFGEYDSTISSYNFEIDSREGKNEISFDFGNKITYNTDEPFPTKLTFVLIVNDVIAVHKTADFLILTPPNIESITDSSTTHEYTTNSRMVLNIKRIKAVAMEDSTIKFQFVNQDTNIMSNPTITDTNKPIKVPSTENNFTILIPIANNIELGQKNLLVKIVDPTGQESSLFTIPVTITQGRQVTESSISCRKTQDMIPDNSEQMFKCNIDNIESNPVYYKAKIGTYVSSSSYSQFNIDIRIEPIGNENEFNVYVKIPEQKEEKTSISFAMITSNDNTVIKYSDITDIKIASAPKIKIPSNYPYFEKNSLAQFEFYLDYICDYQSMKVQYNDRAINSEFQDVISISPLKQINRYGDTYNAFTVTVNVQQL
ncbi:hypothetical protein TVAG_280980 [Trichomonas vaginalis G3]|uniref:Uncharacterized protein n=1 Tax=Trichomonas vaginalis (strain ATCC PRA-98 / G3) TaxID=412133 RepID=A2DRL8_TRIV3|nr:glycoprotein 38 family [Trichomonas vaginalis G3]EAY16981.1 hypothetical protein TVAG_280980 [Trichomonas vaginalis G3]KAI5508972.1 glycoprotein 38 family [Trichomonas vaginalis G3]|eukprot:XP_001329204.1 hypothetical protein [Trichomonas vaginalis G3]